jgi:hypothetical protein
LGRLSTTAEVEEEEDERIVAGIHGKGHAYIRAHTLMFFFVQLNSCFNGFRLMGNYSDSLKQAG